jgi:ATP-dependent DNA ligase
MVFSNFEGLSISKCPFRNLPESGKGRWGEGLTADDMKKCRWLKPQLVAAIEFLEWTLDNHLRHPKFVALRDDRVAREVNRERQNSVSSSHAFAKVCAHAKISSSDTESTMECIHVLTVPGSNLIL